MDTFTFNDGLPADRAERRALIEKTITDSGQLCSKREFAALFEALTAGRAELGTGGTELELHMVYKWGEGVRLDDLMRDSVLTGELYVDVEASGELAWGTNTTPAGPAAEVAARRLLSAFDIGHRSETARHVMTSFTATRLRRGYRVAGEEMDIVGSWVDESLAKSALFDLVVHFPSTLIAIGPDGGIAVRIGSVVDRSAPAAA